MNCEYIAEFGKKLRERYLMIGGKDNPKELVQFNNMILLRDYRDSLVPILTKPKTICQIVLDETIPCLLSDSLSTNHPNLYLTLSGRGPFARLLGLIEYSPALPYINELINHDLDPSMRSFASEAIIPFGKKVLPLYNDALKKEENEEVLNSITTSMLFIADESSLPSLINKSDSLIDKMQKIRDEEERFDELLLGPLQGLFKIFSYIKHPASLSYLKSNLNNKDYKIQQLALRYVKFYERELESKPKIINIYRYF